MAKTMRLVACLGCAVSTLACNQAPLPAVPAPEASGSGQDFVLAAPAGVELAGRTAPHALEGMPATRYQSYRGPGFELQVRYGPARSQPASHELFVAPKRSVDTVVEERITLDGRQATIRRWRRGEPHARSEVDVDAPGSTRGHDFNAMAMCETAAVCAEAEAIVRSVRFLR